MILQTIVEFDKSGQIAAITVGCLILAILIWTNIEAWLEKRKNDDISQAAKNAKEYKKYLKKEKEFLDFVSQIHHEAQEFDKTTEWIDKEIKKRNNKK
jgi:hypothetical protein